MRPFAIPAAAALLAVVVPAALAGEGANFDPDVADPDDVEPGGGEREVDPAGGDEEVEPKDRERDVEPPGDDPGVGPGGAPEPGEDVDLQDVDDEAESRGKVRRELPPHGQAERPSLPRIGVSLLYPGEGVVGQAAADVGIERLGEDTFLRLNLGTVILSERWAFAPRLSLRLRIVDEAPEQAGALRNEDWDEVSDYARLVAFVQVGHVGEPFFLRFGELPGATVGHGSFVNRYYNTIDIDHYQGGVYATWDPGFAGVEALLDNVFDPDIAALRGFARPFSLLPRLPFAIEKLKVGATLAADFQAPTRVREDNLGLLVVDEDFQPIVDRSTVLPMVGADVEVPIVSTPRLDVVPYTDVNLLDPGGANGAGVHTGTYVTIRFTPLTSWRTRVEVRRSGDGYEPTYVDPFYEVHRLRYRGGDPKVRWLRDTQDRGSRSGFYGETELDWAGVMNYSVVYANDQGPENTDLVMSLQFPHLGAFRLGFFFARLDFDDFDDFFDPQDTVMAVGARYSFAPFFVKAGLVNEWWLRHTEDGGSDYETVTDWNLAVGLLLRF